MFEILLLTPKNIPEIAKRSRRSEVDLVDEYVLACKMNQVVFVSVLVDQPWESTAHEILDQLLKSSGLTLGEFREILKGDFQYIIDRRLEWMQEQLDEADIYPEMGQETRQDLMNLVEADRLSNKERAQFIRSPFQWLRRQDPVQKKIDSETDPIKLGKAWEDIRRTKQIRGW